MGMGTQFTPVEILSPWNQQSHSEIKSTIRKDNHGDFGEIITYYTVTKLNSIHRNKIVILGQMIFNDLLAKKSNTTTIDWRRQLN